jgi:mono/diheme cytochrome c family protein
LSNVVRPDEDSDSGSDSDEGGDAQTTKVGFALVEPILKKNCTSCHGAGGTFPDLSTYEKASQAGDRIVRSSASDVPSMPQGTKLTDGDKKILRDWKAGGYIK